MKRLQDKAKEAEKKAAAQLAAVRSEFSASERQFREMLKEKDDEVKRAEHKAWLAGEQQKLERQYQQKQLEPIAALKAQHQLALDELKAQHREVDEDFAAIKQSKLALNNVVSGLQSELHDYRARVAQLTGKDFSGSNCSCVLKCNARCCSELETPAQLAALRATLQTALSNVSIEQGRREERKKKAEHTCPICLEHEHDHA